jgi:hypothetical protein
MKHTRSIGKLTIVLGIGVAMLTGNLAPNISIAVDAFTPNPRSTSKTWNT